MTENRYGDELVKHHALIYSAIPHAHEMHAETAKAIYEYLGESKFKRENDTFTLELGCGEGETTSEILKLNLPRNIVLASDISSEMIERARNNLREFDKDKCNLKVADAFKYLPKVRSESIDVFTSTWTLHNFTNRQRNCLIREAYRILKPNGLFVVMDKMYDENLDLNTMFREQIKMYSTLDTMGRSDVRDLIVQHERDDFQTGIRIDRGKFLHKLQDVGFSRFWTTKRIINDEVVCAIK